MTPHPATLRRVKDAANKTKPKKIGKKASELRRYTDVSATLDMLLNKHFALVDPSAWDDKNDSYFLRAYQECSPDIEAVRVACLTERDETYHHWRIYAHGRNGICQVFNKDKLIKFVEKNPNLRGGFVKYISNQKLPQLQNFASQAVPFLKRLPYGDEGEYRIVYESFLGTGQVQTVPMPLDLLSRIVVSPWTPDVLYLALKQVIKALPDCKGVTVTRSLLTDTPAFKRGLDELLDQLAAGGPGKVTGD